MDYFQLHKQFGLVAAKDEQALAQTNKEIIAALVYRSMDGAETEVNATDDQAEYVVVGIEASSDTAGRTLKITDGTTALSITYSLAQYDPKFLPTWIPMGKGKKVAYTTSGGTVSVRVLAILKRYTSRKPA